MLSKLSSKTRQILFYAILYKLSTLIINWWLFPVLKPSDSVLQIKPSSAKETPRVSLLLPVRDEVLNLSATLPRLLEQTCKGGVEIIILDDGSSDGTLELALELGRGYSHLRVLKGQPLPGGWMGKNWACQQLSEGARGEILIFTDADVLWEPGALGTVVAELERSGADLLTVWPRQQVGSWSERLLVPLIDAVLLACFPYPLAYVPAAGASAGNGQLMAFRREAYQKVGGHARVRGEVLEDVKLARAVKGAGLKLRLALGGGAIGVRMYRGYGEVLEGFGKNLGSFHGGSRILLVCSSMFHLALYTLPWAIPGWRFLGVLGLLERLLVNLKAGRTSGADWLEPLSVPLSPLAAIPVYLRALKGKYRWKGREYKR